MGILLTTDSETYGFYQKVSDLEIESLNLPFYNFKCVHIAESISIRIKGASIIVKFSGKWALSSNLSLSLLSRMTL